MSPPALPELPPISSFGLTAALPYWVAAATAVLGFFGARFTTIAQLQKTLLDASREWVEQTQTQRALDTARILELEAEILRQRGVINAMIQFKQSLFRLLERHNIPLPPDH